MKINSYELEGKLKQQIEGVYIFSGNDPFWLDEATATVQNYAVKAGFTKDNIYTFSDDELKTDELIEAMSSPGLFADRVLVKLKIHDLKVKGKKLLEICSECINPSLLLIIHVPRLSLAELNKNKPLLFLADHGIISIFYDPDQRQIIDFIRRRAYSLGLSLNQGATAILYSAYEGNVEGMVQVLQKMELCGLKGEINEEQMREHISSDAHFSAFDYIESLLDEEHSVTITIAGFASPVYKEDYNLNLSHRRIASFIMKTTTKKLRRPFLGGSLSSRLRTDRHDLGRCLGRTCSLKDKKARSWRGDNEKKARKRRS